MHPYVIQEMTTMMQETFGNPSSIHGFGRIAHEKLETARQLIADSLQVNDHEIIFNSGGTEGDNTAILETAFHEKRRESFDHYRYRTSCCLEYNEISGNTRL